MIHETFTTNDTLARLVGQGIPAQFTTTSYAIWLTDVLVTNTDTGNLVAVLSTTDPVFPVLHAEVFGSQTASGVNVTKIEWTLPGSNIILSRLTFDGPTFFGFDLQAGFFNPTDPANGGGVFIPSTQYFAQVYSLNDTLTGGAARDIFNGMAGNDTITGGGGIDLMSGGFDNDTFVYRAGDAVLGEQVTGDDGIDHILAVGAAAQRTVLQAGAINVSSLVIGTLEQVWTDGHEVIVSNAQLAVGGFNTVVGKTGAIDVFTVLNGAGGNLQNVTFTNWGSEDLIGILGASANAETFSSSIHTELFQTGAGDDIIVYDAADAAGSVPVQDIIDGGTHVLGDMIRIVAPSIPNATPHNGIDLVNLTGATINGIERLEILSGQVAVRANQLNHIEANTLGSFNETQKIGLIFGGDGPELLTIQVAPNYLANANNILADFSTLQFANWSPTEDRVAILINDGIRLVAGTSQSDYIEKLGSAQAVNIRGEAGNDEIRGSNGSDFGNGNGGWFGLDGGAGDDIIFGLNGTDVLIGGTGNDVLNGGNDGDVLDGGAGDDIMDGGAGFDTYVGGLGNDAYYVRNLGADGRVEDNFTELANQGIDGVNTTVTLNLNEARYANIENGYISGTAAVNLGGSNSNNVLVGNAAANSIYGLGGRDVMRGGLGADTFVYLNNTDTGNTALTRDVIQDFTHLTDKIDLKSLDANGAGAGNGMFVFQSVKGTAFTGVAGQLHYLASGANTLIEGDFNGDSVADFQIELTGTIATLTGGIDIIL